MPDVLNLSASNITCCHCNFLQVQNLIERCLQLYMNRGEVVRTLSNRARIEPGFITLGELAFCFLLISCKSSHEITFK